MACSIPPHTETAVAFASALIAGNFAHAHRFLTPVLRQSLTPERLCEELSDMIDGYTDGEPMSVIFDPEFVQTAWATKHHDDIGRVYLGIHGNGFVEAVTVIIAATEHGPLIRNVEWGRP